MCFSLCQEANFWDESGVGQVRDGHVVTWRKMMIIKVRFWIYCAQKDLRDYLITHVKSQRQWLLITTFIVLKSPHKVQPEHCNGAPRIFSQRFLRLIYEDFHLDFLQKSQQQSMENQRNFKTFELRTFQKTSNKSRTDFNITKFFIGINAELQKFSGNRHLVTENLV